MKILIAGLSSQSATAVELIARAIWIDATFQIVSRDNVSALPQQTLDAVRCDICVVDLSGLGWGARSEETEIQLEIFLADRNAVLLVAAGDGGGWLNGYAPGAPRRVRAVLQRPASVAALRQELLRLVSRDAQPVPAKPRASKSPAAISLRGEHVVVNVPEGASVIGRATPIAIPIARAPIGLRAQNFESEREQLPSIFAAGKKRGRHGAPTDLTPPIADASQMPIASTGRGLSLAAGGYAALLAACPDAGRNQYLNLILKIVMSGLPHELHVTTATGAVFHPAGGWVASNIRSASRDQLLLHPVMLQTVDAYELPAESADERAAVLFGHRDDGRRPLPSFMWSLAFRAFDQTPPESVGDLRFQLHRFPNFTRLPKASDLFLQLSSVCIRAPQSITDLQRTFSGAPPNRITQFVVCALLSGMATVLPPDVGAATSTTPPKPRAPAKRMRGMFKALLEKLF